MNKDTINSKSRTRLVNEVMAKNTSGITDEMGEFEDWIELYNGGSAPVDLAGLYLTDALPPKELWKIPAGISEQTTILPNGYLSLIADGQPSGELLHTGFKLNKDGDQVALLKIVGLDTIVIDYLQFGAQTENVSWGRFPDGSDSLKFMPVSSPMEANFWEAPVNSNARSQFMTQQVTIYPVPTDGRLFVQFNNQLIRKNEPVHILIYSNTGRLVSTTQHAAAELIELSLFNQPEGIYMVRIIKGKEIFNRKVVVN